MDFSDYVSRIAALGRDITPDMLNGTRDIIAPLLGGDSFDGVDVERDVSYGDHERHRLDIFTADRATSADRPLLMFVHGGGFVAGDKRMPDTPFYDNIGAWAVRHGFNAINMTYRLAPDHQWPAGVEDIHRAVQWLKAEGDSHGVRADKLFLMGQSAGACHVAHYISHPEIYAPDSHELSGAVLLSGMFDFTAAPASPLEKAYLGDDSSVYAERSALTGVANSEVPLLVAAAELDPANFEAQSLMLLQACLKARGHLPKFVHMIGQNHLSGVLFLGLEGDLLGPQLAYFINQHA